MVLSPLRLATFASAKHGSISESVEAMVLELQGRIDRINDIRSNTEKTIYKVIEGTSMDGKLITGEVMIQIDEKHDTFAIIIKTGEEMVEEHTSAMCGDSEETIYDEDGDPVKVPASSGGKKSSDDIKVSPLVRSKHDVA